MAIFEFKAKDKQGKIIIDTIEAASRKEAGNILREQKLQVLTVKKISQSKSSLQRFSKVPVIEKAIFCRYMSTMMKAGLPISEAIAIIAKESPNKKMHRILVDMQYSIQRGQKLSAVFARYPEVFDSVFLSLAKAGEQSGTLEQSFEYLSKQLMKSYELTQKVRGALLYPAVIISAMFGVGMLMMVFVLPRISQVFLRLRIELPFFTKILLQVSDFFGKHSLVVVGVSIAVAVAFILLLQMKKTKLAIYRIVGKLPIMNRLFTLIDLARFSRTFSTMLKSGVPIIESIKVSVNLFNQAKFSKLSKTFEQEIEKGKTLSEALAKGKGVFPALMIQSVSAGEKSGSLEVVLAELAEFYEQEVENSLKGLTSIIEPVLMLIIGIAVGAMVISIIAPIYSVIGNLQPT